MFLEALRDWRIRAGHLRIHAVKYLLKKEKGRFSLKKNCFPLKQRDYDFSISEKAIRGIWRSVGLLKKKRSKHKTKNDLRAVRALWKLFEQTCVDTNELDRYPGTLASDKTLNTMMLPKHLTRESWNLLLSKNPLNSPFPNNLKT